MLTSNIDVTYLHIKDFILHITTMTRSTLLHALNYKNIGSYNKFHTSKIYYIMLDKVSIRFRQYDNNSFFICFSSSEFVVFVLLTTTNNFSISFCTSLPIFKMNVLANLNTIIRVMRIYVSQPCNHITYV